MRILVRTPNWVGDIVMALPAIAAIRRHFEGASLTVATPERLTPLFGAVAEVDAALGLPPASGWSGWRKQVRAIEQGAFDIAILLPNSFQAAWVVARAGIPERWGYRGDARRWLLTKAVGRPPRRRPPLHQAEYFLALVAGLGIEGGAPDPRLSVQPHLRARARELLQAHGFDVTRNALVAVAPGAAYGHAKRWLPDRFAQLMVRLTEKHQVGGILVGGAGDRDAGYAIESSLASAGARETAHRWVNLIDRTDLGTMLGALSWCRAVVANDSGALHLAAALGVPVVGLYGPTDERTNAPLGPGHQVLTHPVWCRPCWLRECPIDHRCMKGITTDRVAEAVGALLRRAAGNAR